MVASSTFPEYAVALRGEIDAALDRYTQYGDGCPPRLREAIRHSLLAPGKRLRPLMVLMAAEACGSKREAALPAACAVEMIHTYSLIHDDLPAMDDDDLRRGLPTCHAKYGEAAAILAGDALLAQAFEIIAVGIQPPALAARCCAELAEASGPTQLVGGQAADLLAEFTQQGLKDLEAIHSRKTGAIFRVSLRLGGLAGRASEAQLRALDVYGQKLGLAFQIVDDLLDHAGDEAALGKRAQKDSQRGKLTFPSLLGVESIRRRADELIAEACQELKIFEGRAERLQALARYVLDRNR